MVERRKPKTLIGTVAMQPLSLMILEFGFRQHEKGHNLEHAAAELQKIMREDHHNPNGETVTSIRGYLEKAIEGFKADPADSNFNDGYLACLQSLFEDWFLTQEQRREIRKKRK